MNQQPQGAAAVESAQYLTFELAGQQYGLDILRVQEIKGWDKPTQIPQAPAHVLGVINLRGTVVPVIDLRTRFGLEQLAPGTTTVVIVVRVDTAQGGQAAGIVVDAVCEVCNVSAAERRPAPEVGSALDRDCVTGLALLPDRMLILLGVERLVTASLLESLGAAQAA